MLCIDIVVMIYCKDYIVFVFCIDEVVLEIDFVFECICVVNCMCMMCMDVGRLFVLVGEGLELVVVIVDSKVFFGL